ncbi:MAG: beta-ketoacyl-ACP synthase II [Bacillota bacterium]
MRRVVVTGIGLITPLGDGCEQVFQRIVRGESGVRRITRFDASEYEVKIGAEVDFEPEKYMDKRDAKRMDRFSQMAVAASALALTDAGLSDKELGDRAGVCLGTGIGGMETLSSQFSVLFDKGPSRVSPFFIPMMIANMAAGNVAIRFGARGPNTTLITACAASSNAVGEGMRYIREGVADVMIVGGSEAAFVPLAVAGFASMKALSTRNHEPERASRPFDRGRDGFVMGEGAASLILEEAGHAQRRGARIYAELAGYGLTADAYHITAPSPDGEGARRAMQMALDSAGVAPEEVDYINAHGTSTPANDATETQAIRQVFGEHAYKLAVSSTKSVTGHLLGAAGALEAAVCVLAITNGRVPPTINYEEPDPECDLDYVPNVARDMNVRVAMSNSFGFGGQNAVLLFRRFEP